MAQIPAKIVPKGTTFQLKLTYKVNGVVTSLVGYTFTSQVKKEIGQSTPTTSFTVDDTHLADGYFYMTLEDTKTALMDCGESLESPESRYYYDVLMEDGIGNVSRIIDPSIILVDRGVTELSA